MSHARAPHAAPEQPGAEPVFVDPSGRRRHRSGAVVLGLLTTVVALGATTVTSVTGDDAAPAGWHPGPTAHVTTVGR